MGNLNRIIKLESNSTKYIYKTTLIVNCTLHKFFEVPEQAECVIDTQFPCCDGEEFYEGRWVWMTLCSVHLDLNSVCLEQVEPKPGENLHRADSNRWMGAFSTLHTSGMTHQPCPWGTPSHLIIHCSSLQGGSGEFISQSRYPGSLWGGLQKELRPAVGNMTSMARTLYHFGLL